MGKTICRVLVLTLHSFALISGLNADSDSDLSMEESDDGLLAPRTDCSLEWFKNYKRSYDANAITKLEGFVKCKSKISKNLQIAASGISEKAKRRVTIFSGDLEDDFYFRNNRAKDIDITNLYYGFRDLLEVDGEVLDEEALLNPSTGRSYLSDKFHSTVDGICQEVYEKLQPFIELFDSLGEKEEVIDNADGLTKEWITRGRVCQVILSDPKKTVQLIFDNLHREVYFEKYKDEHKLHIELKQLDEKVHSRYEQIEPDRLIVMLKRMEELFERFDRNNLLNLHEKRVWKREAELVEFSNFDEAKCNVKLFEDILFAMAISEYQHPRTIYTYLVDFSKKQLRFCGRILRGQLDEGVAKLTKKQRRDIIQLGELTSVVDYSSLIFMDATQVDRGVLHFLKSKSTGLNNKTTKEELNELFKQNLDGLCESVYEETTKPLRPYYAIGSTDKLRGEIDHSVMEWMIRGKICGRIWTVRDQVIQSVLNLLAKGR